MVLPTNPVIALVNAPAPVPSEVLVVKVIVGLVVVLQQTPLPVTAAPPMAVTFPPQVAAVTVITEMAVVVTVGVVPKLTSGP